MAKALAEAKMLHIERAIEGDAFAIRPSEVFPFGNWGIGVAIMLF
jgi:hypothetical protein